MAHVESIMYSSTWSILKCYRDSVVFDDDYAGDQPQSPASRFQVGNPFEKTKRLDGNDRKHRYNLTPDTLSPVSPGSPRLSDDNGYASSQTSASSYNERRKRQRIEIRARRSPNGSGSHHWPADLPLTKTNGATQIDDERLPHWNYSKEQLGGEVSPPPLPPKNALRNSLKRDATGLRPNWRDDQVQEERQDAGDMSLRSRGAPRGGSHDIDDSQVGSLRQGLRRPANNRTESNGLSNAGDGGPGLSKKTSTGKRPYPSGRKPSETQAPLTSRFSDSFDDGFANPFAARGNIRANMGLRPTRNDSVDTFGDPKSPRNTAGLYGKWPSRKDSTERYRAPDTADSTLQRPHSGSNYGDLQSARDLSNVVRNNLRSPSEYGGTPGGAPPSSSYLKTGFKRGLNQPKHGAAESLTSANLATPFSQPDFQSTYNPEFDAATQSSPPDDARPPPLRYPKFQESSLRRADTNKISPRSEERPTLAGSRRDNAGLYPYQEPAPLSARPTAAANSPALRENPDRSGSPLPPPPPPKVGLPSGPKEASVGLPGGPKPAGRTQRQPPPKVAALPKDPPKAFNMTPVITTPLQKDAFPRFHDVSDGLPSSASRGRYDNPPNRDLGVRSPPARYSAEPSRFQGNANPYAYSPGRNNFGEGVGPGPTAPPSAMPGAFGRNLAPPPNGDRSNTMNSDSSSSQGYNSSRSGFSHGRSESSASSNSSIPVGASAFGRLSSGPNGPLPPNANRGRPGPSQGINVTSDAGLSGGPYPRSASRGPFPPQAPSSGRGIGRHPMPSPGGRNGSNPAQNGPPPLGRNPRIGPPLPSGPGVGITPVAHKRMASTFSTASGPGAMGPRDLASVPGLGGGPYPSSAPTSGGDGPGPRQGPPLGAGPRPGPPMGADPRQGAPFGGGPRQGPPLGSGPRPGPPMDAGMGGPGPQGPADPPARRGPQGRPAPGTIGRGGRPLPPGAGFGLPGAPRNVRAGVPGRPAPPGGYI